MASKIHLEVVTPEGVRLQTDVDELVAPSVEGEFGVLPEHRPLLAGLRTGILRFRNGQETQEVAIGPGFAKVQDDRVSVLTDHFIRKEDVDPVLARKDLKDAEVKLAALVDTAGGPGSKGVGPDGTASDQALRVLGEVRWAAVRLELYGDPPPATIILPYEVRLLGHEDYTALASGALAESTEDAGHSSPYGS